MKLPPSKHSLFASLFALSGFFGMTLAANELVPLNEFISAGDFSQNFSVSAGFPFLSVIHSADDDGGIGRGGFVTLPVGTGATSNLIYDTDGGWGTQTFGDATISVDHRFGSTLGFFVRGNDFRGDAILVALTDRARVRVLTGANPSEAALTGAVQYDSTGPAARSDWSHLRLSVRNAGGDRIELMLRVYDSQVRFDQTTLVAEHSVLLSVDASAPYLAAGEIGLIMFGVGNRIDNFAVHEHGTAPVSRPHPELTDFVPTPGAQFHLAADGFGFRAAAPTGIDSSSVSMMLNGLDVSNDLIVSGDPEDRAVHYAGLDPETEYVAEIEVVAGSGEITTRRVEFSTTPPPTPVPLIDLVEFADETDFTDKFTTLTGPISFVEEWDEGIGRGGFVRGTNTGNTVYDTDGVGDTQVFQDFTATMDHRIGGSITFIIRGNRDLDQSIRVTLTNRTRMRVWSGSSLATGTSGPLEFDETIPSEISDGDWVHLRLDVRNVGPEWDEQIEIRLRAFDSQTDLVAPGFDLTYTLPSGPSFNFLEAGEVGFRTGGGLNDIDNFGIYEYGTAPVRRPHPEIRNVAPEPGSTEIGGTLSFEVTGQTATPQSGIQVSIDGADVSGALAFTGDDSHWFVSYPGLQAGDKVFVEATNAEATTTAFFDYPPEISPFLGRLRGVYNSGGFQDDSVFPLGDLLNVQHGSGLWTPHASAPAQIVEVEEPFDKVLRLSTRNWLSFPEFNAGILTLEMDLRVSSPDVRTLDLTFTTLGSGTQRSFIGWGTVAGEFTYFDGSNWIPVFSLGTDWRRYRMVNYLSGPYVSSYDLFVDGVLVGEKLPFRSTFNPEISVINAIRLNASSGAEHVEIDNLVLKAQPLMGTDELPYATVHSVGHAGNTVSISFETYLGYDYAVEYTDALDSGAWTELATVSGNGGTRTVDDPGAGGERRFYRVTTLQ